MTFDVVSSILVQQSGQGLCADYSALLNAACSMITQSLNMYNDAGHNIIIPLTIMKMDLQNESNFRCQWDNVLNAQSMRSDSTQSIGPSDQQPRTTKSSCVAGW